MKKKFKFSVEVEVDMDELKSHGYDEKLSKLAVKEAFVEMFNRGHEKLMEEVCDAVECPSELSDEDKIAYFMEVVRSTRS